MYVDVHFLTYVCRCTCACTYIHVRIYEHKNFQSFVQMTQLKLHELLHVGVFLLLVKAIFDDVPLIAIFCVRSLL